MENLDAMTVDELVAFWKKAHGRCVRTARELFPDRRTGYIRATQLLRDYAMNKAVAVKCRPEGKIMAAMKYEDICERIYKELPEWARW
jgi:hypothetical protein